MSAVATRKLLLAAAVALTLAACGKSASDRIAEAAISAASGEKVDVDRDGDTVTIHGKDGQVQISAGEDIALPADFPDDVFLPDDYHVKSTMKLPQARMLTVIADGSLGEIYAQADKAMLAKGWEQTMAMQQGGQSSMLGYRKEQRQVMLSLSHDKDDNVVYSVQLSTRQ